jgi:hypothetical protein
MKESVSTRPLPFSPAGMAFSADDPFSALKLFVFSSKLASPSALLPLSALYLFGD